MIENQNSTSVSEPRSLTREVKLTDMIGFVWGHKLWYVLALAVCVFVAGLKIYRTPSEFSRTAKVIVDETSQDKTMSSLTQLSGISRGLGSSTTVQNEQEAFSSPDLLEMVIERNNLNAVYVEKQFLRSREMYLNNPFTLVLAGDNPTKGFVFKVEPKGNGNVVLSEFRLGKDKFKGKVQGRLGDTLTTPIGRIALIATEEVDKFDDPVYVSWNTSRARAAAMSANLSVSASKTSTVLEISYKDNYPNRAELIISSLIDVYNKVWIFEKNVSARNSGTFLNERLEVIERELRAIEDDLKAYKANNNITDVKALGKAYLQESAEYSKKTFELNNQLAIASYIKEHLNDPQNSKSLIPANLGLEDTGITDQIKEYNSLVLKRDRLALSGNTSNPLVDDFDQALNSLRTAILRSVDNLITALNIQADKAAEQEKRIMRRIANSSSQEFQLLSMERQQKVKESLYTFLLERREENELKALVNVGNIRLIVKPNGSPYPIAPKRMMILLIALILGLAIPFAVFYLRFILDNTVKSRADLEGLKVPFLSEVPLNAQKKKSFWKKFSKKDLYDDKNTKIIVKAGKRNGINEAYRVLRTNLDMMLDKTRKSHVIMLTSYNPNAGKTFTIVNMAASMAIKGAKTIVVDLDMRKGTGGKALGVNEKKGVAAYLAGKEESYKNLVVNIQDNLYCLPVGTLPPNPTELLLTDRYAKLIEELRSEYDYIFLDCPPVEIVADASIITQQADMTIFVIRAGLFDIRMTPIVNANYDENKYKHMAVILNAVGYDGTGYGYGHYGYGHYGNYGYGHYGYGHYGYGYGYGNGHDDDE